MSELGGSYARVARAVNAEFRPDPPVVRQQVYAWHKRRTRNAAGRPFPAPVSETRHSGRSTKESVKFLFADVLDWYREGPSYASQQGVRHNEVQRQHHRAGGMFH